MSSRIDSLSKKKDFAEVFKKAKNYKNDFFVVKVIKNNLETNRFAFIVSQKVSKKATVRNKVRRRMFESSKKESENLEKGFDVIFIALPGIEEKQYSEIASKIKQIIIKADLIKR